MWIFLHMTEFFSRSTAGDAGDKNEVGHAQNMATKFAKFY